MCTAPLGIIALSVYNFLCVTNVHIALAFLAFHLKNWSDV